MTPASISFRHCIASEATGTTLVNITLRQENVMPRAGRMRWAWPERLSGIYFSVSSGIPRMENVA